MADPTYLIEQAVGQFLNNWNCGLQPSLYLSTNSNGAVFVCAKVTSSNQPASYGSSVMKKSRRSGQSSRLRRKYQRSGQTDHNTVINEVEYVKSTVVNYAVTAEDEITSTKTYKELDTEVEETSTSKIRPLLCDPPQSDITPSDLNFDAFCIKGMDVSHGTPPIDPDPDDASHGTPHIDPDPDEIPIGDLDSDFNNSPSPSSISKMISSISPCQINAIAEQVETSVSTQFENMMGELLDDFKAKLWRNSPPDREPV